MKSRLYLWSAMAGSRSLTIAALMLGGIACGYSPEANGHIAASVDNHSLDGLEGGNLSKEQHLALWSGYSEATEADGLTTEQVSARRQYEEISLESLFSALPVIVKNDESLAFEMFGRSQPQEGEQETVIETVGTYENYRVLQLTNLGAADDSIGGQRYRFEFEYFDNDQLNLVWVGQQRYCRHTTPPQWTHERCP
ncbi:hypothetical protein GS597_00970 [Synechococcales cyanobacterium C]|uniref:Lipoprotein n=1 Tax=Petrachloros mirabilis ULC683 TaxID=2781853 RepID=A0A8K2A6B3_9CYAN|nr:hypothetical protein [Petrachloros mirabilis]NCJ05110.1 hypothetical protein [Petrachloros mirabilis ULC683]